MPGNETSTHSTDSTYVLRVELERYYEDANPSKVRFVSGEAVLPLTLKVRSETLRNHYVIKALFYSKHMNSHNFVAMTTTQCPRRNSPWLLQD